MKTLKIYWYVVCVVYNCNSPCLSFVETFYEFVVKVGSPTLPAWAKSLKKGTKIEYYWSVQDGWLSGTVQDTETIINELIVTVLFGDGETVRLPFDPEEKIRWRPAGM